MSLINELKFNSNVQNVLNFIYYLLSLYINVDIVFIKTDHRNVLIYILTHIEFKRKKQNVI